MTTQTTSETYARQIWRHVVSGETYVVELTREGQVIAAAGPLHYSDIAPALDFGDFDSDAELVDDLTADASRYDLATIDGEPASRLTGAG